MDEYNYNPYGGSNSKDELGSKFAVTKLTSRVVTIISLVVSIAFLNSVEVKLETVSYNLSYKDFNSYKYMFYVAIIGVVHAVMHIPFAIYHMKTKKHLISSSMFLKFEFYADKVMVVMLAAGVGAAFGATIDMKKYFTEGDNASKFQDYLSMAYIPSASLLVGCIASAISSIHSSFALFASC